MGGAPAALVWLGVGCPATSTAARVQLALGLALPSHTPRTLQAFDPLLTPADGAVLSALGVHVPLVNRVGAHRACGRTLVLMPHCVRTLYNNMVRANADQLGDLCIVGNHLREMATRAASPAPAETDAPALYPYVDLVRPHEGARLAQRLAPVVIAVHVSACVCSCMCV
jgi:hypothetical protein